MRTRNIDKEEIVKQKAIELLAKHGFEGFSVNKLAKACKISVATLYIYYKDKDDLIIKIAVEETKKMSSMVLKDFKPDAPFEVGLKQQWKNRSKFMLENPITQLFLEQLRSSTYQDQVFKAMNQDFKSCMGEFMKNAVDRGEIKPMPLEVYWAIAFAPLYTLIRFHNEGRSIGGKPFKLNEKLLWETFSHVLKALKK
jgi:TetR/AcrR family transcriptional repressor of multidrug resistance operon